MVRVAVKEVKLILYFEGYHVVNIRRNSSGEHGCEGNIKCSIPACKASYFNWITLVEVIQLKYVIQYYKNIETTYNIPLF